MGAGVPTGVTGDIVRNTIHEIELLFSAVWNLIALTVNPLRKADDTKTATEEYISAIPGLARDIIQNISLLITGNVSGTGEVLFEVVDGELSKIGPALVAGWHDLVKNYLTLYAQDIEGKKITSPDNLGDAFASAMDRASLLGVGSRLFTLIFEMFLPKHLNTFNWLGPQLAELSGYGEVIKAWREPLFESALKTWAQYHWNNTFKPEYPDEADAITWHSRGLIGQQELLEIFKYSPLKQKYEQPFVESAYRAISAFIGVRLLESGQLTHDEAYDVLQFNGYRPVDIERLITYSQWAALQPYRAQYLSAVINTAERGILTDAEVDGALTDIQAPQGAAHFVHLTIATRKLEQLAELYRKSISEAYKYSLITDAEYVPALEAIGIAAADANAHFAVDSEAKLGKEAAAAARAAARLAAETTRAASKAALLNYAENNIDEIALAAALVVAGLPAQIIPFAVDVATLRRQASQRNVFGKLVNPRDAILLREQVAALKEQVIKKLLDTTTARTMLQGLGLPNVNIEDLLATWAAQALKTVLPVQ